MKKEIIKKLALLILATIMCLSFCACSSSESKPTSGTKAETTTKKQVKIIDPKPGKWVGNTYKNESTNITFTIDDDYYKYTPEEMKKVIQTGKGIVINGSDEITTEDYMKQDRYTLYENIILLNNNGANVVLLYEKMPKELDISSEKYLKQNIKRIQSVKDKNMNYKFKKYAEATIAGDKYKTAELDLNTNGDVFNQIIYARVKNGYAISFITTNSKSDNKIGTDFMSKVKHIK